MIRITQNNENDAGLTLGVEGRIVAGSVDELVRECQEQLRAGKRLRLDFSSVTYVDVRGAGALRRMIDNGAEIVNHSALIKDLLEEDGG